MTDSGDLKLAHVLVLRWGGMLTWLGVLLVLGAAGLTVDFGPPLVVVAIGALANLALHAWARRRQTVPDIAVAGAITLDITLLTVLLALTGGPVNPFSLFYLVHVAAATVALSRGWAWAIAGLSALGWRLLFLVGADPHAAHDQRTMELHIEGMWLAFVLVAVFVVVFVGRLRTDIDAREAQARRLHELEERNVRLTSLATLAGGAAHELSTPLSTIAVIASELEQAASRQGAGDLADDARLLLREVERCRRVLRHMASDAGTAMGEEERRVTAGELVDTLLSEVDTTRVRLEQTPEARARVLRVPLRSLAAALRGLVNNALMASGSLPVTLTLRGDQPVRLEIVDHGPGMEPGVLSRVGEPFFTTRAVGQGMGLGVFLARTVVGQAGGSLQLDSQPGRGTTASITLPTTDPE